MNKLLLSSCILLVLLTGCNLLETNHQKKDIQLAPVALTAKPAVKPFPQDTLATLLIAEFAGKRGQFELALHNYVQQAEQTKDPKIAERAYQMASYLDDKAEQLAMALLWVSVAPNNIDANRAAAIELTTNERGREATPYFEKVLAHTEQLDFLELSDTALTNKARQEVIVGIDQLLVSQPNKPQLIFTKALLQAENGLSEEALITLKRLPNNKKPDHNIVMLKVYLLQSIGDTDEALALLDKEAKNHPQNKRLRLNLAQRLISNGKILEAKQQFLALAKQYPNDLEVRFALALVCLENKDWDEAIGYLRTLQDEGINPNAIYYYLASAYNEKGDKEQALANYRQVTGGENYLAATANTANILFERKQISEAQQLLAATRKKHPELATALYLFEVEQLQKGDQLAEAMQVINQALLADPQNITLLYSRAILAEQTNNLTRAEQDLRQIIKLDPNNDTAINALGYILTDRTTRYQEALILIRRALEINPDNPAALDSFGWVKYKLGDLTTAQNYLQQAYTINPDPEIAAHLGEVLWKKGQQQQAKTVWSQALTDNPTNKTLHTTIKRLTGAEEL